MNSADNMIMVINRSGTAANNLKGLIEFMDAPDVRTATPTKWRQEIGDRRLEAVFVGPDISDNDIRGLVDDIGKIDPNIPIVMISEDQDA